MEALHEAFSDFITEAMADQALASAEAYDVELDGDYDYEWEDYA